MENFRDRIKIAPKDKYKINSRNIKDFPYYNMYEKDGKLIGRINPKHELRQGKWLQGVSCFVINEKGEVLLEQRTRKGLTPGKIDLVSGHMEKEETAEECMKRELQEEVGINVTKNKQLKQLGAIPLIFESGKSRRKFKINFFCYRYNNETIQKQPEEVENIFWIPMEEVFELIRRGKTKFPYNTRNGSDI